MEVNANKIRLDFSRLKSYELVALSALIASLVIKRGEEPLDDTALRVASRGDLKRAIRVLRKIQNREGDGTEEAAIMLIRSKYLCRACSVA